MGDDFLDWRADEMTPTGDQEKRPVALAKRELEDQLNDGGGPQALLPLVVGLTFIADGLLDHTEKITGARAGEVLRAVALAVDRR